MRISVFDRQEALAIDPSSVKEVVQQVLAGEEQATDEVSIYFVETEEISELHEEFFGDPAPTDCISFPMDSSTDGGYHVLGEAFICPQTAIDYIEQGDGKEDVYYETTLYLVHSLLHLLGYDDQDPKERAQMRLAERRHLENLLDNDALLSP